MILCGAILDHQCYKRCLFLGFEAVLGLKINLGKSKLVPVANVDHVERLAGVLGCGVLSLPMNYLGLLLGAFYKVKHIWDGVIEKIKRQLAS